MRNGNMSEDCSETRREGHIPKVFENQGVWPSIVQHAGCGTAIAPLTGAMLTTQTTLQRPVEVRGVGLHTGVTVGLRLCPAPAYTGIVFCRTDLDRFEIPARPEHVAHVSYATTLVRRGVMISTVEHVLSALVGCGVDNVLIEIDSLEVPILDGSALPFVEMIEAAGKVILDAPRYYLRVRKVISVEDGNKRLTLSPHRTFTVSGTIDFPHPLIGRQTLTVTLDGLTYWREIAPARTFGFLREVEELRRLGLIRGGSLENAVVLDGEGILNPEGLRFADEFVRHKVLDLIGDLALLGHPVLGRIEAERPGHALNTTAVRKLLSDPQAWELTELDAVASAGRSAEKPAIARA